MSKRLRLGLVMLSASMAAFASGNGVLEDVERSTAQLMQILREERDTLKQDHARLRQVVKESISPFIDFPRISRRTLGKHWRNLSVAERSEFMQEFEIFLLKLYGTAFLDHADDSLSWKRMPGHDGKYIQLRATSMPPGGTRFTTIDFFMSTSTEYEGYKVFDIKIEGISLVVNFRHTFVNILSTQGINALLEELRSKNADSVRSTQ